MLLVDRKKDYKNVTLLKIYYIIALNHFFSHTSDTLSSWQMSTIITIYRLSI